MARRKEAVLQIEIESEDDWKQLLEKKGLILIDVFSSWCGPCVAMVSMLRSVKMEVGDAINYAIVKNDYISDLERFRERSEPVWMFLENGQTVNMMFGANCPQLRKLIMAEIKRVQYKEEPEMQQPVSTRTAEEEIAWQEKEAVRYSLKL